MLVIYRHDPSMEAGKEKDLGTFGSIASLVVFGEVF